MVSPQYHNTNEGRRRLPGIVYIRQIPFLLFSLLTEHLVVISINSPDEPPTLKVLLDDLHGDAFLKADFILPLTGVRLNRHVFLLYT